MTVLHNFRTREQFINGVYLIAREVGIVSHPTDISDGIDWDQSDWEGGRTPLDGFYSYLNEFMVFHSIDSEVGFEEQLCERAQRFAELHSQKVGIDFKMSMRRLDR